MTRRSTKCIESNPKIQSKGVKSVRKRVAKYRRILDESISIDDFKQIILKTIFGEHEVEEYKLTDEDLKNIEALSNEIPYMGLELRAKS